MHPGDAVEFPGFSCTLNFLWRDSRGNRYFGTAGHCTLGSKLGTVATDGFLRPIGRLVYSVWAANDVTQDFALIRLLPNVRVSGRLRYWGGPTGTFTGFTAKPVTLCFFGEADGLSWVDAPRNLLATAIEQPGLVLVNGLINSGDSGAPVIDPAGRAIGWIVQEASTYHLPAAYARGGLELGEDVVTRIGPAVAQAERTLGIHLQLVTSPQPHCTLKPLAVP